MFDPTLDPILDPTLDPGIDLAFNLTLDPRIDPILDPDWKDRLGPGLTWIGVDLAVAAELEPDLDQVKTKL